MSSIITLVLIVLSFVCLAAYTQQSTVPSGQWSTSVSSEEKDLYDPVWNHSDQDERIMTFLGNRCSGTEVTRSGLWLALGFACFAAAWSLLMWVRVESKEERKKPDIFSRLIVAAWVLATVLAIVAASVTVSGTWKLFGQCHTIQHHSPVPSDWESHFILKGE